MKIVKLILATLAVLAFSKTHAQCSVEASYTYTVEDGIITFYNTSTGVFGDPNIYWYAGGYHYEDDSIYFPVAYFDTTETVCLYYNYYPDSTECNSYTCSSIIIDGDTTGCSLDAGLAYEYLDGNFYFENTSSGVPADAIYEWHIEDLVLTEENPIVSLDAIEDYASICLTVSTPEGDCIDSTCTTLEMAEDTVDCTLTELDFTYYVIDDSVTFINTSTDIMPGADFTWLFGWYTSYDEPEDIITVPLTLVDSTPYTYLQVNYDDPMCSASLAAIIDTSPTPCLPNPNFWYMIEGDSIHLYGGSYLVPGDDPQYLWTVGDLEFSGEDITLAIDDLDEFQEFCLTVHDPYWICYETRCRTFYLRDDSTYCDDTDASFSYTVDGDEVTLTSTSTGVMPDAHTYWRINGGTVEDIDGTLTFDIATYGDSPEACYVVTYPYPASIGCKDSACTTLFLDTDTTIYTLFVDFDYTLIDGELILESTSTDLPTSPGYYWTIGDLSSTEESPSFLLSDLSFEEEICLTITDLETGYSDFACELATLSGATINEENLINLSVYPNPAKNEITIQLPQKSKAGTLIIYDLLGQELNHIDLSAGQNSIVINLDTYAPGTYIVQHNSFDYDPIKTLFVKQ